MLFRDLSTSFLCGLCCASYFLYLYLPSFLPWLTSPCLLPPPLLPFPTHNLPLKILPVTQASSDFAAHTPLPVKHSSLGNCMWHVLQRIVTIICPGEQGNRSESRSQPAMEEPIYLPFRLEVCLKPGGLSQRLIKCGHLPPLKQAKPREGLGLKSCVLKKKEKKENRTGKKGGGIRKRTKSRPR